MAEAQKKKRRTLKPPAYRLHKGSGQARVRLNGEEIYLGKFGTPESQAKYAQLIAEYNSSSIVDGSKPVTLADNLTIAELVLGFLTFAKTYYCKNGKVTDEYDCIKSAVKPLIALYGTEQIHQVNGQGGFGPLKLKAVRQSMIDGKTMCRGYINKSIGRIRRCFRWGVSEELVQPEVLLRLESLGPLLAGRCDAVDHPTRRPVPEEHIAQVRLEVKEVTRDILDLILLSGARPGELTMLKNEMIDRSGEIWLAKLADHKTVHHGKERVLVFGPRAQLILRKYVSDRPHAKLFGIARATVGNHVTAACDKLKLPRWSPHWLRHNAGSRLREEFGLDVAQVMLGHSKASMTELYAHLNLKKAVAVARDAG